MRPVTRFLAGAIAIAVSLSLSSCAGKGESNKLVILHTNDTHSQIEPGRDGLGGVLRRKAVIDSIRAAEPNVLLVDAGDAVQGTLYFYLYGGIVEQEIMNILGVDMRILGNHEFDNGADSLAAVLARSKALKLASNYDLEKSALNGMFEPYTIREFGDKKIGFIGINLNPEGMITKGNYDGVEFLPIIATANLMASKLKEEEKVDAVVALSHIGYAPAGLVGDSVLAVNSRGIDIIIGGHSHDTLDPLTDEGARRSRLYNLDGEPVLVVQTGKAGRYLGKIEIDLDRLGDGAEPTYELIRIDNRYDGKEDKSLNALISRYAAGVDSLMHNWVTFAPEAMSNKSTELLNFLADFVFDRGKELDTATDFAIVNKGSLRADIPQGNVSEGHIINMEPFRNYINVVELKGSDIKDIFDVMASTGGNGISRNVSASYGEMDGKPVADNIFINGKPLSADKTYRVATLDYLAKGGDYMTGFTHGTVVASSDNAVFEDLLQYFRDGAGKGKNFTGSSENRWSSQQ